MAMGHAFVPSAAPAAMGPVKPLSTRGPRELARPGSTRSVAD